MERKIQNDEYDLWVFEEGYMDEMLNRTLEEWSYVYNDVRPHLSLGYLIPIEFLSQWMEEDYLAGACPPWSETRTRACKSIPEHG